MCSTESSYKRTHDLDIIRKFSPEDNEFQHETRLLRPLELYEYLQNDPELWEDGMVTHHNWDRQLHFDFIDEDIETNYLIDKWNGILDNMIYSFGKIMEDAYFDNEEWEMIQEGLDLFAKHYTSLWD